MLRSAANSCNFICNTSVVTAKLCLLVYLTNSLRLSSTLGNAPFCSPHPVFHIAAQAKRGSAALCLSRHNCTPLCPTCHANYTGLCGCVLMQVPGLSSIVRFFHCHHFNNGTFSRMLYFQPSPWFPSFALWHLLAIVTCQHANVLVGSRAESNATQNKPLAKPARTPEGQTQVTSAL